MREVQVNTACPYRVLIGSGAVCALPEELKKITAAERVMVVTDEMVAALHLSDMLLLLDGWEVHTHVFPAGEEHKTVDTLMPLLKKLLEAGFDRSDLIVAFGGGVVGDMAGFAASMYMRGIDFVNIPTTLLSQVDSSVGGKTAVDFMGAKNILGAFYQPRLVICDTDYLAALPEPVFADGCAEVIKYAFIGDEGLLQLLESGIQNCTEEIVCRCVQDKADIVASDEFDRGRRGLLNFGHTVGHAIEKLSGCSVSHGCAVAMGMLCVTAACEKAGLCESGVYDRLLPLLRNHGLPVTLPYSRSAIVDAARADKKKNGDSVSMIVPRALCRCEIRKMTFGEMDSLLQKVL